MIVYDSGLAVRIERHSPEGWITESYLQVVDGTSAPQLRFFTEHKWAEQAARRYTPLGCRAVLTMCKLVPLGAPGDAIDTGNVRELVLKDGRKQISKTSIGDGNRVFVKLFKRRQKCKFAGNNIFIPAKFVLDETAAEELLQ